MQQRASGLARQSFTLAPAAVTCPLQYFTRMPVEFTLCTELAIGALCTPALSTLESSDTWSISGAVMNAILPLPARVACSGTALIARSSLYP